MKYCVQCVMPDTRPGIEFDAAGVCSACRAYANRKSVDYAKRFEELVALCDRYRNINGTHGYGMLTRERAVELVRERDHRLDPKAVKDFCDFLGYRESEFWRIVDRFYNPELFEKNGLGEWKLKHPVWDAVGRR